MTARRHNWCARIETDVRRARHQGIGNEARVGACIYRPSLFDLLTGESAILHQINDEGDVVLDTPATMREATFFGRELEAAHLHGTYASLEGGFRLEALPDGRTRLTGNSRYLLTIAPASYWNLWTRQIVSQVQLRVMNHVKAKAEAAAR